MLVLMLAEEGYFSSNAFTGDRFFIRNCLFSSYLLAGPLSCLPTFGDVTWFFMESLRDALLLLLDVFWSAQRMKLLKFIDPGVNPVELRMDCLRPNCGLALGVTPGAYISPLSVMVYSKISFQSIRLLQSFTKMRFSSFYNVGDILGQSGMTTSSSYSILISLAIDLLSKGHFPNTIWYSTTPTDHISALIVYISPLMTQGAMQIGEPNMVWANSLGFSSGLQKPKSAILMLPLFMSMLSGLMSLCMMLLRESTLNASTICLKYPKARFSGKGPSFCMSLSSVPPLQYSQTKQKLLAVLSMSMYLTIQGQDCRVDRMLISLTVHSSSLGISLNFSACTTLMATSCLVTRWTALQTLAQTPSPNCYFSSQFQIIFPI